MASIGTDLADIEYNINRYVLIRKKCFPYLSLYNYIIFNVLYISIIS